MDHLVLAYRDLDAAAGRFRDAGFLVSARNAHPWGTCNHVVQFDGAYLELIGLGPDFQRPAPDDPVAPFAGHVADFLERSEGLAMVALRSADARADLAAFAAAGLSRNPLFLFERTGLRDGRPRKLAFSLAFLDAQAFDAPRVFVCQHHHPENFWDAAAQAHPNGVVGIDKVSVTFDPARLATLGADSAPFAAGATPSVTLRRRRGSPLSLP